jgi:N-acetylmuramoyl-L-alanine amidase
MMQQKPPPDNLPSQTQPNKRRLFLRTMISCAAIGLSISVPATLLAAESKRKMGKHSVQNGDSEKTPAQAEKIVTAPKPVPKILMIDAGHGGKDPGAIGRSGVYEKDVTLDVARRMAHLLGGKKLITPYLTRDKDEFIPLADRVDKGRSVKADFFISVHADSAKTSEANGFSVYSLSEEATDDFARDLAQQENLADRFAKLNIDKSDQDVANILFDLATRQNQNIAQRAKVGLVQGVGREWRLLNNPIRAANFVVLRAPDVPSILVETGFLSNAHDEALLRQPQQREKIAGLLARELATILASV